MSKTSGHPPPYRTRIPSPRLWCKKAQAQVSEYESSSAHEDRCRRPVVSGFVRAQYMRYPDRDGA